MAGSTKKRVNLALQGGGSHGAFTCGVLDRLCQVEGLEYEGISGASSGAINAVIFADGYMRDGPDGARKALKKFWHTVGNEFSDIFNGPFMSGMMSLFNHHHQPALDSYLQLTKSFSPYQLNPMDMNPLRELVAKSVNFKRLRKNCPFKLFIAATHVKTGKLRIFENHEITIDTIMASACLPSIHHAVEIDGESYWDGGFSGNPPVFPLIFNCHSKDIIIVVLQPLQTEETPKTADEIQERASEISFNTAFLREMRAIAYCKNMIKKDWLAHGKLEKRLHNVFIHLIENKHLSARHSAKSRYNTLPSFLDMFREEGQNAANDWLTHNYDQVGISSTIDLTEVFT